ncbi:hypothetical protein HUK65_06355 [Rhodobacteraceae bacterium 2376]|uniref:Uncharacterized protein n=1 Tax=Rhabdonatronobacter sediminivivens TaxID=2743469 RepID=A0A7Z0HYF8_9RHOB|nr:hypothetical protein [Rhabdonatronobacter sediminivivens]NYS24609.1 hypothetical protein [Rhabdonatronobacter sediminivivens]
MKITAKASTPRHGPAQDRQQFRKRKCRLPLRSDIPVNIQRDAVFSKAGTEKERAQNEPGHCKTDPPRGKLNPGALAGATGADSKADSFKNEEYRLRLERARILCLAIADCDPRDACQIMAAALDDLSAGMPGAPLFSYMDQAAWWSDLASKPELKAYLLACWTRLSPRVQDDFLRFIERRAAA